MAAHKYRLEKTAPGEAWDKLTATSPNATVFSHGGYLAAIRRPYSLYFIYREREIRGGLVAPESAGRENAVCNPLLVYAGVLFPPVAHKQNRAQVTSERFELCEAVAEALPGLYNEVELALSPGVNDIRPFLWYNYGSEGRHFIPDVRYTAEVPIAELAVTSRDESDIFAQCAAARRQEVRYAVKKGVTTAEEYLPDQFTEFYALTLGRQGIAVSGAYRDDMRHLIVELGKAGKARMFAARTAKGETGSMAVMALDQYRAYYLFGANDPALRDTHCGSAVIWDAFAALAKSGVSLVDMEGVNSPRRGWFKLSFGGILQTYYEMKLL
jgi:hypothetical protein